MAKKGGAPENLKPIRTTEEAKKRGRNGGVKSGEARRKKRDAQQAAKLILDMGCSEQVATFAGGFGVDKEDQTNVVALMARAFTLAMNGDVSAMRFIVEMAGETPRQKFERQMYNDSKKEKKSSSSAVDDWIAAAMAAEKEERGSDK